MHLLVEGFVYGHRWGSSMGSRLATKKQIPSPAFQRINRRAGVLSIATELRRQERTSDFTGYAVNYSFRDLQHFLRSAGGSQWELSLVPMTRIKCWHTSASLKEIRHAVWSSIERSAFDEQIKELAAKIRRGQRLPGIFLVKSHHDQARHWILDGHRRLIAHRVAKAANILVYHPRGMFGVNRRGKRAFAEVH